MIVQDIPKHECKDLKGKRALGLATLSIPPDQPLLFTTLLKSCTAVIHTRCQREHVTHRFNQLNINHQQKYQHQPLTTPAQYILNAWHGWV